MADKSLQPDGRSRRELEAVDSRRSALRDIDDRFQVGDSVRQLKHMMNRVTEKEMTADNVNAACNCISNINTTIKTAIAAAKFLSDA